MAEEQAGGAQGANGGTPPPAAGGAAKGGDPGGGGDWFGPLGADDGTRQLITTKGFKNINDVAKGYTELEKAIGRGVVPPSDKDPPEAWAKFNKRIGAPEDPTAYKIEFGPEATESEKRFEASLRPAFVKAGLTQRQVNILLQDGYQPFATGERTRAQDSQGRQEQELMRTLDAQWGPNRGANMAIARRAAAALIDPEKEGDFYASVDKALGGSARTVELFYRMGQLMSEGGVPMKSDSAAGFAMTPDGARRELEKMNADPEISKTLRTKSGPNYGAIRDKWNRMQDIVAQAEATR